MGELFYTGHFKTSTCWIFKILLARYKKFNFLNARCWKFKILLANDWFKLQKEWYLKVKWSVHATAISDHFCFCYCSVLTNNLNQSAPITSWVIHMKKDHPLRHVQDGVKLTQKYKIHYFPIPMIHLVSPLPSPPKNVLHKHCFQFLLGFTILPRKLENNTYAIFFFFFGGGGG